MSSLLSTGLLKARYLKKTSRISKEVWSHAATKLLMLPDVEIGQHYLWFHSSLGSTEYLYTMSMVQLDDITSQVVTLQLAKENVARLLDKKVYGELWFLTKMM